MKRCVDNEDENCIRKKAKGCAEMIRPSDVPAYLHDSEFYKSLNLDDDEKFHMPSNLMKANSNVKSLQDLADLLNTIRYWGVDMFPKSIMQFSLTQEFIHIKPILESVEDEFPIVEDWLFVLDKQNELTKRMEAAMEWGDVEIVRHLEKENSAPIYTPRAIALAAECNRVDCLEHALRDLTRLKLTYHHKRHGYNIFEGAVANGHIACVKILYNHGIRFAHNYTYYPHNNLAKVAAAHGQLECLKFLHEKGCYVDNCLIDAASSGDFACVQYVVDSLHVYDWDFDEDVSDAAARGGNVQCLKYVHEQGCPLSNYVCVEAATVGSAACLAYAHTHGCTMSTDVCTAATTAGSLECLQYYFKNGELLHSLTCHIAALHGHLACLEYAHTHGCSLTPTPPTDVKSNKAYRKRLVEEVAMQEHWGCVSYLIHNNYPLTNSPLTTLLARAQKDSLLRLAVERGCPVSTGVAVLCATNGDLEGLTYAHQHGCRWSKEVCMAAARGGHLECLKYAREHGCPWDVMGVRRTAARKGYEHIVTYGQKK